VMAYFLRDTRAASVVFRSLILVLSLGWVIGNNTAEGQVQRRPSPPAEASPPGLGGQLQPQAPRVQQQSPGFLQPLQQPPGFPQQSQISNQQQPLGFPQQSQSFDQQQPGFPQQSQASNQQQQPGFPQQPLQGQGLPPGYICQTTSYTCTVPYSGNCSCTGSDGAIEYGATQ